ncbi:hypothetical protein AGIG_G20480 [Arapaima gigas]
MLFPSPRATDLRAREDVSMRTRGKVRKEPMAVESREPGGQDTQCCFRGAAGGVRKLCSTYSIMTRAEKGIRKKIHAVFSCV